MKLLHRTDDAALLRGNAGDFAKILQRAYPSPVSECPRLRIESPAERCSRQQAF